MSPDHPDTVLQDNLGKLATEMLNHSGF